MRNFNCCIVCGGYTAATITQGQALTEEYDGSSWSESGDLSTSRYGNAMAGTQTAGLTFGGYKNPPSSPSFKCNRRIQWFFLDN